MVVTQFIKNMSDIDFIDPQLDMDTLNVLKEALDPPMFIELINMYITESQENYNKLVQALQENDMKNAIMAAHSIKGSSGNVGAMLAYEVAKDVEAAGKAGDANAMYAMLPRLQNVVHVTCEAIKSLA
jgi:HPt (histidine-containing phosphotransfer) domain-containing protein